LANLGFQRKENGGGKSSRIGASAGTPGKFFLHPTPALLQFEAAQYANWASERPIDDSNAARFFQLLSAA
jgi:hypothetical protein